MPLDLIAHRCLQPALLSILELTTPQPRGIWKHTMTRNSCCIANAFTIDVTTSQVWHMQNTEDMCYVRVKIVTTSNADNLTCGKNIYSQAVGKVVDFGPAGARPVMIGWRIIVLCFHETEPTSHSSKLEWRFSQLSSSV